MCELLGMSANVPTDICFSFSGLAERGGRTGPHADGWGIAFYDGDACRTFHDPHASAESEIARLVSGFPIKSCVVISHIRQATHGRVCLANTHPFVRELWGRHWCFAHNGKLPGVKRFALSHYKPVGTTDSEHAFCWMMGKLRERWPDKPPRRAATLGRMIRTMSQQLSQLGTFNLLLSDARHLYCFCTTKLCWITRRAPFGVAQLKDADMVVDFEQETTPNDVVTIVVTEPLTQSERWTRMKTREFVMFQGGEVVTPA
ncbi:MAG: putative glutamine amidotransferase [Bradymonadia bacterium]|jgi:predicted glutamine amidotransferase